MILINTQNDLDILIHKLSSSSFFCIDTEFESIDNKSYFPQLCLIQIYTEDNEFYVIDCLEPSLILSNLNIITNEPSILKIIHGSSNDLIILKRYDINVKNIFDIQIGHHFIYPKENMIGYDKLVLRYCNQIISKTLQYSKWSRRPISSQMSDYLKKDVIFLPTIQKIIKNKIQELELYQFFLLTMKDLETKNEINIDNAYKKIKIPIYLHNNTIFLTRLSKLCKIREDFAIKSNIKRENICSNKDIIELCIEPRVDTIDRILKLDLARNTFTEELNSRHFNQEDIYFENKIFIHNEKFKKIEMVVKHNIMDICKSLKMPIECIFSKSDIKKIAKYIMLHKDIDGKYLNFLTQTWKYVYFQAMIDNLCKQYG